MNFRINGGSRLDLRYNPAKINKFSNNLWWVVEIISVLNVT
jgi:hypothetical protein